MDEIIKQLAESGVRGGTIIEGTGMSKTLVSLENLPIFEMLKRILADDDKAICKVMMFVLKDEQVVTAKGTIKKVIDLNTPNTGIMFAVPITDVEGLGET